MTNLNQTYSWSSKELLEALEHLAKNSAHNFGFLLKAAMEAPTGASDDHDTDDSDNAVRHKLNAQDASTP